MTASRGCSTLGSGTVSQRMPCLPCQASAFKCASPQRYPWPSRVRRDRSGATEHRRLAVEVGQPKDIGTGALCRSIGLLEMDTVGVAIHFPIGMSRDTDKGEKNNFCCTNCKCSRGRHGEE